MWCRIKAWKIKSLRKQFTCNKVQGSPISEGMVSGCVWVSRWVGVSVNICLRQQKVRLPLVCSCGKRAFLHVIIKSTKFMPFLQTSTLLKSEITFFFQLDESTLTRNVPRHHSLREPELDRWSFYFCFIVGYKIVFPHLQNMMHMLIYEGGKAKCQFYLHDEEGFQVKTTEFGPQLCCLQAASARQHPWFPLLPESHLWTISPSFQYSSLWPVNEF